MTKVLVTGANGLLATNTINELIENGYFVKALVRNKNKFILADKKNIEVVEGDITDYSSIEFAIKDCEFIIHTAAKTKQGLSNYHDYSNVNILGTENLFTAAIKNGVKKIVHVSTSNVFGFGTIVNPGNETIKIKKPFSDSLYVISKVNSQNLAFSFSDKIEIVVVNPTFIIGAYDQKPSSGRIILLGHNKKVIFYPPGGKNFVDVKDVAKGIVSALEIGKNKEAYILSGENLSYIQFFRKLSMHSEKKPVFIKIPCFILILIGAFGNLLKFLGIENETTLTNMRILCVDNYYTNKKTKVALNIKFNGIDEAIGDAIKWFKTNGVIK
jgi:dihydroflavonol-4-reductase